MEDLPFDNQSKILSYVPRVSILDCKLVSKTWKNLLSHRKIAAGLLLSRLIYKHDDTDAFKWTTYAKLRFGYNDEILSHTQRVKDDHRDRCLYKNLTKIKHPLANIHGRWSLTGSCNGLVCLLTHDGTVSNVYIFNPFTQEGFKLPTIDCQKSKIGIGFGYNSSGRNYKVVLIQYNYINKKRSVQVYTLGGDSSGWRNIRETNYALVDEGILWNGSLHWLDRKKRKNIVAFNLADETFQYLPITPSFRHNADAKLILLGGNLSIVSMDRVIIMRTKIWSFKKTQNDDFAVEEGNHPSLDWSLEFNIPFFRIPFILDDDDDIDERGRSYEPFGLTKNNEVLLWYKVTRRMLFGSDTRTILCCYDPKTDTLNKILDCGVTTFVGIPHVNSLVSLKALGLDSKTIEAAADCAECGSQR